MKKKFFGSEHVSSQIWCYLKISEMKRWRGDEMKIFLSEHVVKPNLVLSDEKSEMKRWTDEENFLGPNMYQAKSGVIWN